MKRSSFTMERFERMYLAGLLTAEEMMIVMETYAENEARATIPRRIAVQYGRFSLDDMPDADVRLQFRFEKSDLRVLMGLLGVPEVVRAKGYKVPGITALCILLRRLTYPNRLVDLERMFGVSSSGLSAIAIGMTDWIKTTKGHLLAEVDRIPWLGHPKLAEYAEAVTRKGAPLNNCWAFIDGTARKMCRPTTNQNLYYTGHKRYHCLKYQSILTPDGLIINLQGPFQGRRHDAGIWTGCGVQNQIRRLCVTPERTFILYGDPAYPVSDILIAPFPTTNQQPHAIAFNRAMSSVRQAVEWGFGKVIQQFPFVDFSKNQKLQLQDLGGMYTTAVILTNCHTCLYGSQSSQYFEIEPPTLEQYLT